MVNVLPTQRFAAELVSVDLMCSSAKIEACDFQIPCASAEACKGGQSVTSRVAFAARCS